MFLPLLLGGAAGEASCLCVAKKAEKTKTLPFERKGKGKRTEGLPASGFHERKIYFSLPLPPVQTVIMSFN